MRNPIRQMLSLVCAVLILETAIADDCINELHANGYLGSVCIRGARPDSSVIESLNIILVDPDGRESILGDYVNAPGRSTPELVEFEDGVFGLIVRHWYESGIRDPEDYSIDIYDLQRPGLILSSVSFAWPELEDLDGDGTVEIILFDNPSIDPINMPAEAYGWPIIFTVSQEHGLRREALYGYPRYTDRLKEAMQREMDEFRVACERNNPPEPCFFQPRIELLEQRLSACEAYY